ncbi:MAG: ADP-ribosylglycohydrolase family protein [Synergistaceae bacterium]|nr:ADP-ribosylglycohydrolase family protein [Synergistaceae bacterium]
MQEFGHRYPKAGYGGKFRAWLKSDNPEPYNSWGNGSAMRVSPVAWYFDNLEDVEKFARLSAEVTHNHPEGIKGAQATAAVVFLARTGKSKKEIKQYITEKYNYDLNRTCDEIRPDYSFDVSCQGSVPEAIIAYLEGEDFEDAIRNAISLGGDSDTIACITGAISHAKWGVPERLENMVMHVLDDFMIEEAKAWDKAIHEPAKIKNGITEMVFILDRSGSMSGLESDTIGGFNSMIDKQKQEPGEAFVSTILFDDVTEVLHDRIKLADVPQMTNKEYFTRGWTALLDAMGGAINHIVKVHRNTSPENVPEKTMFVIITDGLENASKEYSAEKVKSMVEHEREKYGWEFLFIGANMDAITEAGKLGIDRSRSVNYRSSKKGTAAAYRSVNRAFFSLRKLGSVFDDWSDDIKRDYSSSQDDEDEEN